MISKNRAIVYALHLVHDLYTILECHRIPKWYFVVLWNIERRLNINEMAFCDIS